MGVTYKKTIKWAVFGAIMRGKYLIIVDFGVV